MKKSLLLLLMISILYFMPPVHSFFGLGNQVPLPYYSQPVSYIYEIEDVQFFIDSQTHDWILCNLTGTTCEATNINSNTNCTSPQFSWFSNDSYLYCVDETDNIIYELDPLNSYKVISSFASPVSLDVFNAEYNGNLITMASYSGEFTIFSINDKNFICTGSVNQIMAAYLPTSEGLVYMALDQSTNTNYYGFFSCSQNKTMLTLNSSQAYAFNMIMDSFNGLSVFLAFEQNLPIVIDIFSFDMNKTSSVTVNLPGPYGIETLYQKINDTHFVLAYDDESSDEWLGLFYIHPDLELVNAASLSLSPYYEHSFFSSMGFVEGGDKVVLNFEGGGYALVNLTCFEIIGGGSGDQSMAEYLVLPPMQLNNGSTLEVNLNGYWFYNPPNINIPTFFPISAKGYAVEPLTGDYIWGLYVNSDSSDSNDSNDFTSPSDTDNCYLIQIQKSTSEIKETSFQNCKHSGYHSPYLIDVTPVGPNDYNVTYQGYNEYFVITNNHTTKVNCTCPGLLSLCGISVRPDYSEGILYAINFESSFALKMKITISSYNISDGAFLNSTSVAELAGPLLLAPKINNDLFIYGNTSLKGTDIYVYSTAQGQIIQNMHFQFPNADEVIAYAYAIDVESLMFAFLLDDGQGNTTLYTSLGVGVDINLPVKSYYALIPLGGPNLAIEQFTLADKMYFTYLYHFTLPTKEELENNLNRYSLFHLSVEM